MLDAAQTLRHIFISGGPIIKPATYRFSFDSGAAISLIATGGEVKLEETLTSDFDVHISFALEDFAKCIDGTCTLADLYSGKRVRFEGDVSLAASLMQAFQKWRQPGGETEDFEFELSKREYLFRKPVGGQSVDPWKLAVSPVLQKWINPYYLEPEVMAAKRTSACAKPLVRYAILDDFFRVSAFDELIARHRELEFVPDDVGLNFDSSVVFAEANKHFGSELFFSTDWHEYVSYIVGSDLLAPGRTLVRLRRHDPTAHGFWPHSDWVNDERGRRAAFMLAYFNKDWRLEDGGIFQLWHPQPVTNGDAGALHRWNDYCGKRLSFLEAGEDVFVEVPVGSLGFRKKKLTLIDQILPEYNRVMICDLTSDPVLHSVSPSRGRLREGFVQWVY